jgi:tRNA dimethylallyltransferase
LPDRENPEPVAIFGPTAIGKTAIAVELSRVLRGRGEDPVAVNCDSIQVYRGLEILSGAPGPEEAAILEHRLISFVPVTEEYSAGLYAAEAHAEIDRLSSAGRRVLLVGGTGLYLRAALSALDLRPAVPAEVRKGVERELDRVGQAEMHRRLPDDLRQQVHPNDRKRIARYTELLRSGERPAPTQDRGGSLWTAPLRRPTLQVGIVAGMELLEERISRRVDGMVRAGVAGEVERAAAQGASRTACAAIGFTEFLAGEVDLAKARQRAFARRQETWMKKMQGLQVIDRTDRSDREVAAGIAELIEFHEA